jgi:uncharacterized integral membrane protein
MTETPASPSPEEREVADEQPNPLRGSRTSRFWIGLAAVSVLLVLLIIFIAQNTQRVEVSFLGWDGHPPLAVALLAATVAGLVVAGVAGTLRILQLHRRVRRSG